MFKHICFFGLRLKNNHITLTKAAKWPSNSLRYGKISIP